MKVKWSNETEGRVASSTEFNELSWKKLKQLLQLYIPGQKSKTIGNGIHGQKIPESH